MGNLGITRHTSELKASETLLTFSEHTAVTGISANSNFSTANAQPSLSTTNSTPALIIDQGENIISSTTGQSVGSSTQSIVDV